MAERPEPERIGVAETREKLSRPERGALLVCAYDDEEKCAEYAIDSALTLAELERRKERLTPDQELIFYCN